MLLMMTTRMKQNISRKRKESAGYYPTGMMKISENAARSLQLMKTRILTIPPQRSPSGSGERAVRTVGMIRAMLGHESVRRGRAGEVIQMEKVTMKRL
jgi:hypothetical protein